MYGGNGTINFTLPDVRDRVALHRGQGTGLTSRTQGGRLGTESETVSVAQLAPHAHNVTLPPAAPALPGWGVAGLLVALTAFGARRISSSRA
jgi:microcystin-dependent protein